MTDRPTAVPPGTRILHVGMHKTATTVIQNAARAHRDDMWRHGAWYPGHGKDHIDETRALWQDSASAEVEEANEDRWQDFAAELSRNPDRRTLVSAEHLAGLSEANRRRLVAAAGGEPHIVITARPLAAMLPSIWQQIVKERREVSFETWLEKIFAEPRKRHFVRAFWQRHDLGALAEGWARVTSPDRVTIVMLDKRRPQLLYDAFEGFLGMPEGSLVTEGLDAYRSNRGLSVEEVDLLRRVNRQLDGAANAGGHYYRLVRNGMVGGMQLCRRPGPEEGVLAVPERFMDLATDAARDAIAQIRATGVRVIGDLDTYAEPSRPATVETFEPRDIGTDVLVEALAGIVASSTRSGVGFERAPMREGAERFVGAKAQAVPIEPHDGTVTLTFGGAPDAVATAADAVAAVGDAAAVAIALPHLSDEVFGAWEHALARGEERPFDAWLAWAASREAWGARGALADPGALASVVAALRDARPDADVSVGLVPEDGGCLPGPVASVLGRVGARSARRGIAVDEYEELIAGALASLKAGDGGRSPLTEPLTGGLLEDYRAARGAALAQLPDGLMPEEGQAWAKQQAVMPTEVPTERIRTVAAASLCVGAILASRDAYEAAHRHPDDALAASAAPGAARPRSVPQPSRLPSPIRRLLRATRGR
ncbi:hypothetical protein [Demequina subtropica]|uniref:hypothetical protein n=1 Tax=Demequina subtropica TaxID=1638989 RepID=UPI000784B951|nr:hypothetical protein [Demequina subtropica]